MLASCAIDIPGDTRIKRNAVAAAFRRDSQGFAGIRRDSQGFAGIRRDSQEWNEKSGRAASKARYAADRAILEPPRHGVPIRVEIRVEMTIILSLS